MVNTILLTVMMAAAHPDLPGPPRHEVAGIGWRSFWWSNLSMRTGKEQLQEPHSQGPGLMAVCLLLLNHFSSKLQNNNLRWAE